MKTTCLVCDQIFNISPAKKKKGKGKFCTLRCYLLEHGKNKWAMGICKGCHKEFKYIAHRKQTCCSLSCNAKYRFDTNGKRNKFLTQCKECNGEFWVKPARIKDGRGKFCSKKCYAIWMSKNWIDEKSPAWRGGKTKLVKKIRGSSQNVKWKKEALDKSNGKCSVCKSIQNVEVDHIIPLNKLLQKHKINTMLQAILCKDLWVPTNARVLCRNCHKKTESYGFWKKNIKNIQLL